MQKHSRSHIHEPRTFGERAADVVASGMGSWRFIGFQTLFIIVWIVGNLYLLGKHPFDPPPFIALNLLFSIQAAYAAPILQLSGNRKAQKDRLRDDHEAAEVHLLYRINRQQLLLLILWPALALGLVLAQVRRRRRASRR